jgi:DNA-binding transcriptional ArsR family regulator
VVLLVGLKSYFSMIKICKASTRRWDIDYKILTILKNGPRTASYLASHINIDKRVLMRHLHYLVRDGIITVQPQTKVLCHDQNQIVWKVKYYTLNSIGSPPTPPRSPLKPAKNISNIHNPFRGEGGMLRFTRWLRDLQ